MSATLISYDGKLDREQLALVPTPEGTRTHRPVPHIDVVNAITEALGFRHIAITGEEYAVSKDGNNFFGAMTLDQGMDGASFALGLRNSHSKLFRLSVTVGIRVFVCENLAFSGDHSVVLAKHSANFSMTQAVSIGIDECQRSFAPMKQRVETWRQHQLTDEQVKLSIFKAFIEDELDAPKHLAKEVWKQWQQPAHPEFAPRTLYSLENSYTEAFKLLEPVPFYRATSSLAKLLAN